MTNKTSLYQILNNEMLQSQFSNKTENDTLYRKNQSKLTNKVNLLR